MRCRISIGCPVYSSKTALIICVGDFIMARLAGVTFSCVVSIHANIASWVNYRKCVMILVLCAGACRVLMPFLIVSYTLGNSDSFIFGYASANNIGDC